MSKKNRRIFNLISSICSLAFTSLLLVFIIFAWYVVNTTATANGVQATSAPADEIQFTDTVKAVRTYLSGDISTETYEKKSNGTLYMVKKELYTESTKKTETETFTAADNKPFSMTSILPGEKVDVTIGFYMSDKNNGKTFSVKLTEITGDTFTVDGKKHYATGAFKYTNISLKDKAGTSVVTYSTPYTYKFLSSYSIDADDSISDQIEILSSTWSSSYEELYYTFRITEDFSQYYALIAQAKGSYGALLSEKKVSIKKIYFSIV